MLKTIKLADGIEVEIEVDEDRAHEISDNKTVDTSISQIQTLLTKVIKPISNTYKELSNNVEISEAKISLGVKIGIEGNFILAKSNASANIQVDITLRPTNA